MFNDPKGLIGRPDTSTRKGRRYYRKLCRIAAKKARRALFRRDRGPAPPPCWMCLDAAAQWCPEC